MGLFAVHQNYVGIDTDKNPYFLSVVSQDSGNKCVPLYRAMLFRKQVSVVWSWSMKKTIAYQEQQPRIRWISIYFNDDEK